jgi:hypothetical protein
MLAMATQISPFIPKSLAKTPVRQEIFVATAKKIHRVIPDALFSFLTGNFFSSKEFYRCIQATLLSASFVGILGSTVILISGMPTISIMMITLSSTTAIGAYVAHQAALQQTFVENAIAIKQQIEMLKQTVSNFSRGVSTFSQDVSEFSQGNSQFHLHLQKLSQITENRNQNHLVQLSYLQEIKEGIDDLKQIHRYKQKTLSI